MKVVGATDYNIVQNNGSRPVVLCRNANQPPTGPRAAQVVPHVHFHIIPRMETPSTPRNWTMFGRGAREDLDFGDAEALVKQLREATKKEIEVSFTNSRI